MTGAIVVARRPDDVGGDASVGKAADRVDDTLVAPEAPAVPRRRPSWAGGPCPRASARVARTVRSERWVPDVTRAACGLATVYARSATASTSSGVRRDLCTRERRSPGARARIALRSRRADGARDRRIEGIGGAPPTSDWPRPAPPWRAHGNRMRTRRPPSSRSSRRSARAAAFGAETLSRPGLIAPRCSPIAGVRRRGAASASRHAGIHPPG